MAKQNDTQQPAETPAPSTAMPQPKQLKKVTLKKGDHQITTTHPGEIANLKALGYAVQK
ncbi:hypothetical protein ACUXNS_000048 [Brevibacterium pityocampae]